MQYLLNSRPDLVMLHKLASISRSNANIHRLDEAFVIFQISAEDLFRQFIRFQASLGGDLC